METTIRSFETGLYDEVLALWRECEGIGLSDSTDSRESIDAYLKRNPGMSFVATVEGRAIGAVLCGHDGRRGLIHHLVVHPEWRRQGLARKLVNECLNVLREAGIDKAHIFVFKQNTNATAFWTNEGWQLRQDISVLSRDLTRMPVVERTSSIDVASVRIRLCKPSDVPVIRELQVAWAAEDLAYGFVPMDENGIRAALGPFYLVAELEGRIVGFVGASPHCCDGNAIMAKGDRYLEIDDLYVVPPCRARGIGRMLLEAALEAARREGIMKATLYSAVRNISPVMRFYERSGFKTWFVMMFADLDEQKTLPDEQTS